MQKTTVAVQNIAYAYSNQEPVLHDISFTLNAGERVALMGPTGSGKSTLLENLIGLKQPSQGKIFINDIQLKPKTLSEVRRYIGFAFQDANDQLFMPTILEDVAFGPLNYGVPVPEAMDIARQLLMDFGLEEKAKRSAHELSGGQRRLAAIAAILALNPDILILDEPTNHLDIPAKEMLEEALQNYDGSVIVVSHDRYFISKVANKIVEIRDGEFRVYLGDYHYYLDKIAEEKEQEKLAAIEAEKAAKKAAKKKKAAAKRK